MATLAFDTTGVEIGSLRQFGTFGPTYEVIRPSSPSPEGKARVEIRGIPSGETVDYDVEALLLDPVAS